MSLLFSALLLACKPSESTSKIQAVAESERIDWDSKIESGEVGFFNPKGDTLIGVDVAPRTRGDKTFRPLIGMSLECRD